MIGSQFALAPTPARAGFLQPNERQWLAARQQRDEDCAKGGAAAAAPSKFLASFLSWRIYYLCILWFCVWTVVAGVAQDVFHVPAQRSCNERAMSVKRRICNKEHTDKLKNVMVADGDLLHHSSLAS